MRSWRRTSRPVSGSNDDELVDLVAEQADPQADVVVRRIDLDDVAAHAKRAARELVVVALVLDLDELAQRSRRDRSAAPRSSGTSEPVVRLGRSQAVDARDARDDDDVAALEERPRRRQPQPIDFLVDDGFLLDVRVGRRHVGFGLVVVVVADEELDGVAAERSAGIPGRAARPASCCAPSPAPAGSRVASTCAIVNVLPDPVTPSSTCARSPRVSPSTSWSIARGWSPRSSKSVSSSKAVARRQAHDSGMSKSPDRTSPWPIARLITALGGEIAGAGADLRRPSGRARSFTSILRNLPSARDSRTRSQSCSATELVQNLARRCLVISFVEAGKNASPPVSARDLLHAASAAGCRASCSSDSRGTERVDDDVAEPQQVLELVRADAADESPPSV